VFSWLKSPLCRDIQIAAIVGVLIAGTIGYWGYVRLDGFSKEFFQLISVLVTSFLTLMVFLTGAANIRTGVATVFESEVGNICNVMYIFGLARIDRTSIAANWRELKIQLTSRSEDYFETFSKNIDKLASLPKQIVSDVTAFFTFLKASRDAVLALDHWDEATTDEHRLRDMIRIANHLYHSLRYAKSTLTDLSGPRSTTTIAHIDEMLNCLDRFLGESKIEI
jgi:hypothetical protein